MTDNGSAYVSHLFAELCKQHHLRHIRTRPYTPRTNGKAERFIQTMLPRVGLLPSVLLLANTYRAATRWLTHYNHRRPHGKPQWPSSHLPGVTPC